MNPLFDPGNDAHSDDKSADNGYVLPRSSEKKIEPAGTADAGKDKNAAIELIRSKVAAMYEDEPNARQEAAEATAMPKPERSRHQQFMYTLSSSGKPLAEIQAAWHKYYAELDDQGKHEVWREFYDANSRAGAALHKAQARHTHAHRPAHAEAAHKPAAMPLGLLHPIDGENKSGQVVSAEFKPPVAEKTVPGGRGARHGRGKHLGRLRRQIVDKVRLSASQQEQARRHFQSMLFGVATGALVILIFLFGLFNEMVIAPFIQPSRSVSDTPIILTGDSVAVGSTPEVIIPKINVQIPVDYEEPAVDEAAIQKSLEKGVVHYASTSLPGEQGNTAIFGHSSNNIFNKGKYKFAFVKLNDLVPGDVFYLTRDKKMYVYKVYDKKIVEPDQTEVLRPVDGKTATATLITCDPPGTSRHRLVVWGEQVSPDPAGANKPEPSSANPDATPAELASEGPTLWTRFIRWLF